MFRARSQGTRYSAESPALAAMAQSNELRFPKHVAKPERSTKSLRWRCIYLRIPRYARQLSPNRRNAHENGSHLRRCARNWQSTSLTSKAHRLLIRRKLARRFAPVSTDANWQAFAAANASTGNQKTSSKSLMPFHFPGWSGSNDVFSTQFPYRAGA